ncbi:MAG: hypothetical protein MUF77_11455 [Leptospira sp.]|jgi:hypothetical protein|nr:hypothetical protein [Leptospira sp.]
MKKNSNISNWFLNIISIKLLLFSILLTPFVVINGCRMLGIKENEKKGISVCGENNGEETDDEINRRLKAESERQKSLAEERRKYTYTFENVPNKNKIHYMVVIQDYKRKFQESSFTFYHHSNKLLSNIVFIAHENKFDETFEEFTKELQSLSGPYKLYIYLATKNLLYVEKITNAIANSNVKLYHISIHSNEPSWYYIKGKGVIESVFLTGNHEIMGVEKSLFVKEVYIHANEKLQEFTWNMDSTTVFDSKGKVAKKNLFQKLFDKPNSLLTLEIQDSELDELPDMSVNDSMDNIKFYNVWFKEIDLNKLPKYTRKFEISLINEPVVILPSTQKSLRQFSIIPTEKNQILRSALEKMQE